MFQFLHISVLCFCLVLPSVLCANLRCYYSPIMYNHEEFELIVTACPPDELCFKADGRYGNYSVLTARGCMAKKDCSQMHTVRLQGTVYTMSYACCDGPYCNSCQVTAANLLSVTLALVTGAVMAGNL